jgi:hypothetical protein
MLNRASASGTRALALAGALFAMALLAGCGGDDDSADSTVSTPAPAASDFPAVKGETLDELMSATKPTQDVAALSGMTYTPGENRVGFGVFTVAREQITDAKVAIYAAHGAKGRAIGPFPARIESLETDPQFEAQTTASDPDAAKAVYVTHIDFDRPGEWRLVAMFQDDDGLEIARTVPGSIKVSAASKIPEVGDQAPAVDTPTAADVGDLSEIDTRDPHDTMHDVNLTDVLGKQPVVLLFATPALCVSRVCGPVVDVAEQVKSEMGADAAFIHMEVYKDNDPNEGIRPQLAAYGLRTEPWLFVIDADGKVSTRIEGAFSAEELREAIEKAGA